MTLTRAGLLAAALLGAVPAHGQMVPEAESGTGPLTGPTRPAAPGDTGQVPAPIPGTAPAPVAGATPGPLPETGDRPFRRLWPNFIDDMRRLPSVDTAMVLGAGGLLSLVALNNDEYFTEQASAGGTDQIFAVGGRLGDGFMQAGLAVGTYVVGRMSAKPAVAHIGADLIRAQLVTGVLTHGIKLAVQRQRPDADHESRTKTYAFPSGHASATWTAATVVWRHAGWKAGVPASLLAAYASASRLQQNQHFMTDVLFGAAIGIASGRTITRGHGGRQWQVLPVPVRGGGAVVFSLVTDPSRP